MQISLDLMNSNLVYVIPESNFKNCTVLYFRVNATSFVYHLRILANFYFQKKVHHIVALIAQLAREYGY